MCFSATRVAHNCASMLLMMSPRCKVTNWMLSVTRWIGFWSSLIRWLPSACCDRRVGMPIPDRVEAYFACAAIAPCKLSDINTRACSTTTDMSMVLMVDEMRSCAKTLDGSPQIKALRITSSFSIFANLAKRRTSDIYTSTASLGHQLLCLKVL